MMTMDRLKQIAISLIPTGVVLKIECMSQTLIVGEHGPDPAPAVDLRAVMSKLLDVVPPGTVINLTVTPPRPPIEDGICTGCDQPTERQVPCPRGDVALDAARSTARSRRSCCSRGSSWARYCAWVNSPA